MSSATQVAPGAGEGRGLSPPRALQGTEPQESCRVWIRSGGGACEDREGELNRTRGWSVESRLRTGVAEGTPEGPAPASAKAGPGARNPMSRYAAIR